jgi:hypothetical protein
VPIEKMGAWYLLMLISFVLVTLVHRPVDACVARLRRASGGRLDPPPRRGGGSISYFRTRSMNRCCRTLSALNTPRNWVVIVETSWWWTPRRWHALVLGVDQHGDAGGREVVLDGVGDLHGHGLLGLETWRRSRPGAPASTGPRPAAGRHVGDPGLAQERAMWCSQWLCTSMPRSMTMSS